MGLFDLILSAFSGSNSNDDNDDFSLTNPGDKMEARVTDNNRKVFKMSKNNGNSKYSATQYPNGTIVETKTTKKK